MRNTTIIVVPSFAVALAVAALVVWAIARFLDTEIMRAFFHGLGWIK